MVFLNRVLFARGFNGNAWKMHTDKWLGNPVETNTTDRWWKKRQTLMQTANFQGRQRNCWKLAIRKLNKTLEFVTQGREQFRRDFKQLSEQRIEAAANENGYNAYNIRDCLSRNNMALNRKVLANLAIWEPRTFRAISAICAKTENQAYEEMRGVGQVSKQAGPGIEIIDRGKF